MAKQELSIPALARQITSEAEAYKLLESLRWPDGTPDACPLCGTVGKFYFLQPRDGSEGRKTRTGSNSQRRVWKCATCRKQFSVLTNTIFHGTKIPIQTWLFVIFEVCSAKNSVSAREIERKYDLTPKTAWFLLHRIREAMKREPLAGLFTGTVAADETWFGGKLRNQSKAKRAERPKGWAAFYGPKTDKPAILALVDAESGEVRSRVIADVTRATLRNAISEQVQISDTTLVTDKVAGLQAAHRRAGRAPDREP